MTNDQSMTKPQCPKLDQNSRRGRRERRLVIGHWAFFGHWSLVIGHYGHRQNARLNSTAVHPGPLPQERENCVPRLSMTSTSGHSPHFPVEAHGRRDGTSTVGVFKEHGRVLPLPGGEGRGEGERPSLF